MSLRDLTKQRIVDAIVTGGKASGWKILIVDKFTLRIISFACRMYDIMEEGISLVENISISREPLPNMDAIYFISTDPASIQALIDDFQDANAPQYGKVHLFFAQHLSKENLDKIKNSNVVKYVKTLREVNLDFIAYESQVFHLDFPNQVFTTLFSPDLKGSLPDLQKQIADKVASLCTTLHEYPIIRFAASNPLAASVARLIQAKVDDLMRTSEEYADSARVSSGRATLLILDRSFDPLTPLLHEFTYQAMVYDLLNVANDHYKYDTVTTGGENKGKETILGETDILWPLLRHMHIADTIEWILEKFEEFVKENKASKLYSGAKKVATLAEMGEAMKAMPQYQEMLGKYSIHINMANECMRVFKEKNIAKIAALEQDMATGEEADGKPVKNILANLPPLLQTVQSVEDKLRLLMIYIISQEGIKDSDRKRLLEFAAISPDDETSIVNLKYLGVTLSKPPMAKNKQKVKEKKKKKGADDAPPYELSRFVPSLKKTIDELAAGSLSPTDYPFVKEGDPSATVASSLEQQGGSSLRKGSQPRWAEKGKRKSEKGEKVTPQTPPANRIIIFIVGGMTYSEMRVAYEVTQKLQNRQVLIGSTHILSPSKYIEGLRSLKKLELL